MVYRIGSYSLPVFALKLTTKLVSSENLTLFGSGWEWVNLAKQLRERNRTKLMGMRETTKDDTWSTKMDARWVTNMIL